MQMRSRLVALARGMGERLVLLAERLKPRTTAGRTGWLVAGVTLFSLLITLAFFWRTLYLPELRQHAHYLAIELELLRESEQQLAIDPFAFDIHEWVLDNVGVELVRDPKRFPELRERWLATLFTRELRREVQRELGEPVTILFEFKPVPALWIHYPSLGNVWIREPLVFYAQYSPELIIAWVLGTPLLALVIAIILVRQLNRPLARLQATAQQYTREGKTTLLPTDRGPLEIRQVNAAMNQMIGSLEQAAAERTIMLAGISHDLRTPLTRMRLTAEFMPKDDLQLQEGLIYDIDDMEAILEQFISYMRDGADEPIQMTDVNAIVQELIVQFKPLHIIHQPQHLPPVPLRSLSIKRMISNLINNARRYGREPIWLSAALAQQTLRILVRDHGDGIRIEDADSLMQPFVRGESARTTQGSGLGLAIVKRIVNLHHGTVSMRNHPEGGLEVTVELPVPVQPAVSALKRKSG